jgi:Icc protein
MSSLVPVRVVQITDTHLSANANKTLLGVNLQTSFNAVIDLIRQHEMNKVDLILVSGDLSHDGSVDSYQNLANALSSFHVPVYVVPGNHDDMATMLHTFPYQNVSKDRHIILKDWQIILLNSQVPGQVHGELSHQQLDFLIRSLELHPERRAIIVFHHQPVPMGCEWLDKIGLLNADEFWEVVSQYSNVNTILFGHVHMESENKVNNMMCYSSPSTCIQFMRKQDFFGLEKLPQGYRWLDLYSDGRVETGVRRLDHYIGDFQVDAKGY